MNYQPVPTIAQRLLIIAVVLSTGGTALSYALHTDRAGAATAYTLANPANEYATIGGQAVQYDAAGNLTTDEDGRTYQYDERNRLVEVRDSGANLLASYAYDALGRRVAATIGSVTTRYYYDGQNVIEERDGPDVRVRYHVNGAQFIDERVATFDDATTAFTYYLLKENFSVVGTGNADGSTIERLDYSATGSFAGSGGGIDVDYNDDGYVDADDLAEFEACALGPAIPQNDPNCAGMKLDADDDVDQADFGIFQRCYSGTELALPECTGAGGGLPASGTFVLHGRPVDVLPDGHTLLFVRARFYDLKNGRWLQRDPTGFADGPNLYESFKSNATRFTDPRGLDSVEVNGEWLDYKATGFQWGFARILVPGLVLINHPSWPYAFLMKQQDAIDSFDTGPFETDFSHPLEIMQKATTMAVAAGTQNRIVAIFDKAAARHGWVKPKDVTFGERAEHIRALAQQGLQRQIQDVGALTQIAFIATTGALALPGGAGATAVDVAATVADVGTGRISLQAGGVVITAAAAGAFFHFAVPSDITSTSVKELRFTQVTAGSAFSEAGRFQGKTIGEVAGLLRSGALRIDDIPVQYIERGGVRLIVDTRSAIALKRAGIDPLKWRLIDRSGDAEMVNKILKRLGDNKLTEEGTSVLRVTGAVDDTGALLGQKASSLR